MVAWIVIATIVLLMLFSGALWSVTRAVIYRVTGDNEKLRVVAAIFTVLILALALVFYAVSIAMYGKISFDGVAVAFVFAIYYCVVVAGLTFLGLFLVSVGSTVEYVVSLIRGD